MIDHGKLLSNITIIGDKAPERQPDEYERLTQELEEIAATIDERIKGYEPLAGRVQPLMLAEAKQRKGADIDAIDEVNRHWGWPEVDSVMDRTSPYEDEEDFWNTFLDHDPHDTRDPNNLRARLRVPKIDATLLESKDGVDFVNLYHSATPALIRAEAVLPEVGLVRGLYAKLYEKHYTMTDIAKGELSALAEAYPAIKTAFYDTYNLARCLTNNDDERRFIKEIIRLGFVQEGADEGLSDITNAHDVLCR